VEDFAQFTVSGTSFHDHGFGDFADLKVVFTYGEFSFCNRLAPK
jgi:hypothetical protein